MKTINDLEEMTHEELVTYMLTQGVIIENITKEEIKDFYRNRLIPEKYEQHDWDTKIDNSDWIYRVRSIDGVSIMFTNDTNLITYSAQSVPTTNVEHQAAIGDARML